MAVPLPRAILFDLDDTLADRAAGVRKYARCLHGDFRGDFHSCTADDIHSAIVAADDFGSMRQATALAASPLWRSKPQPETLFDHWRDCFGRMATCVEGVVELLKELRSRNVKLAIVTNGGSAMQRSKIAALGIEPMMDAIIVSSEVGLRKPDPKIFGLALHRLEQAASNAWFVGDHPDHDIRGAIAAGLKAFWIKASACADEANVPGIHLASLSSLREHLERM